MLSISIQSYGSDQKLELTHDVKNLNDWIIATEDNQNLPFIIIDKKETKVYIKIIDSALNQGDEELFYKIFGDICDKIAIEHLLPAVAGINYTKITDKEFNLTQNGNEIAEVEVCPQPFYMMQINPDGNIVPCCSMETAYIVGNCTQNSLLDIWNGQNYQHFQILQLKRAKHKNKICAKCQSYKYNIFNEDILDNHTDNILKKIEMKSK